VTADEWARDVDIERPSPARMYDYFLGGSHNFAVDREAAEKVIAAVPHAREVAAANRAFLRHAVLRLLDLDVRQFLDIGSGIPTVGNVHEIVQRVDPSAAVVYVDVDPVAVAHGQHLLGDNPRARAIAGDLAAPHAILDSPEVRSTMDLGRPVGLLLLSMLQFVPDEQAYPAVAELVAALPSGSYVAIWHGATEAFDPDQYRAVGAVYQRSTAPNAALRDRAGIARFFDGLQLLEPGLVWVSRWPADPPDGNGQDGDEPDGDAARPERLAMLVGVARKP
jgi:hypothetical protein